MVKNQVKTNKISDKSFNFSLIKFPESDCLQVNYSKITDTGCTCEQNIQGLLQVFYESYILVA